MEFRTRAKVTYDLSTGGESHAPMIACVVRGHAALFVLDTGSDVHLLTKELVDATGLDFAEGEPGTDHSGATFPSWDVEDIELQINDDSLRLTGIVAIPAPPPFLEGGIGGILSAHKLFEDGRTVIDLASNEMFVATGTDSQFEDWLKGRARAMKMLVVNRDPAFDTVVVPASISGHAVVPTLINTGGKHTEFAAAAAPAASENAGVRVGAGVSGTDAVGAAVGDVPLLVEGQQMTVPLVVRDSMLGPQGMIGMDVLRGTIIAVATELNRKVLWQIPEHRTRRGDSEHQVGETGRPKR